MPDRIRVLWLIKGLGPGGAERLLTACAAVRDREAFDYRAAYLLPWKAHLVPDLERLDVGVECLTVRDERDLRWARRLRTLLLEDPVDVVHAHSPYAAGIGRLVVRSLPRARRPRLVSTEHNAWSTFGAATRALNAVTGRLDDAVIAVSGDVRDSIRGPAHRRTVVVTHGIQLEQVRALGARRDEARAELGVGPAEVLVATVANYVPKKDYPNLLEAARRVGELDSSVRFCAIGQGPREKEVRDLRHRLGLDERVTLTGYREDAVGLLAGADIFVLASRFEGLPVALMEALALGLPVVATSVGGVPEAVDHGVEGLLVPPGQPVRLAAAIAELAGDPVRRKEMGDAAAARSVDFDIRRAVTRIEAIYRDVVGP